MLRKASMRSCFAKYYWGGEEKITFINEHVLALASRGSSVQLVYDRSGRCRLNSWCRRGFICFFSLFRPLVHTE